MPKIQRINDKFTGAPSAYNVIIAKIPWDQIDHNNERTRTFTAPLDPKAAARLRMELMSGVSDPVKFECLHTKKDETISKIEFIYYSNPNPDERDKSWLKCTFPNAPEDGFESPTTFADFIAALPQTDDETAAGPPLTGEDETAAEAKRIADEDEAQRVAAAEAKRIADEAVAQAAADAALKAEAEAKRIADEAVAQAAADAALKAKAEAEAKRIADEAAAQAAAAAALKAEAEAETQRVAKAKAKRIADEAEATRKADALKVQAALQAVLHELSPVITVLFKDSEIKHRNFILSGPPGIGKTHKAIEIKKLLDEQGEGTEYFRLIQFHPAKTYEDFVVGLRIEPKAATTAFVATAGDLLEMCSQACETPSKLFCLWIDEINRANLPAVLGECIYALEYRGKPVKLPYENIKFQGEDKAVPSLTIPDNLLIIGTMNTADRSTGTLDYAIRRRFAFIACKPDIREVQKKYQAIYMDILRLFYNTVKEIEGDNPAQLKVKSEFLSPDYDPDDVAIGHTYFRKGENVKFNWTYKVRPMLDEYRKDGVLIKKSENDKDLLEEAIKKIELYIFHEPANQTQPENAREAAALTS